MVRKSMDGNEAAAYASYAFTEVFSGGNVNGQKIHGRQ